MRYLFCSLLLWTVSLAVSQNILSPDQFLKTDYRSSFTPYMEYVRYLEYLDDQSPMMQLVSYGVSYEKRPLHLMIVSSEKNLENLDMIRQKHLAGLGMTDADVSAEDLPVVWLSFGVHGNEAATSESALNVLYELAHNPAYSDDLSQGIVIIDPAVNPDGYERYTQWNRAVSNHVVDVHPYTYEHSEPWPGGRLNHYQFDLNRDWAWATQTETQQRLRYYQHWLPHVHVDVHEMYYNDPYYFAPAAEPFHQHITNWQRQFQTTVGEVNASSFDQEGWAYFTREVFDLFYPSYGDTYPTFNGAIGMTYEQGGHSQAGRAIQRKNGDTLTIADRIEHHSVTTLNTITTSIQNGKQLIKEQQEYFLKRPKTDYKSYVIHPESAGLENILKMLDAHGVLYGVSEVVNNKDAYSFNSFKKEKVSFPKGSIVIPVDQPKAVLVDVLLAPESTLVDSLTYDITAWSLLHSIPGPAYALNSAVSYSPYINDELESLTTKGVAYVWDGKELDDYKEILALMAEGFSFKYFTQAAQYGKHAIPVGAMVLRRQENQDKWSSVSNLKADMVLTSGMADKGPDLGSDQLKLLHLPKIGLITGDKTDANANGHIWHFFERTLEYPISRLSFNNYINILKDFNTIIFPNGNYNLSENDVRILNEWVAAGGKIIAEQNALSVIQQLDTSLLNAKSGSPEDDKPVAPARYRDRDRSWLSGHNPGVVVNIKNDETHPVTAPLGTSYAALLLGRTAYDWIDSGYNVSHIDDQLDYHGFLGSELHERFKKSMQVGLVQKGGGSYVLFANQPLFRGFWYNGQLLFASALLKG